MHPPPHTFNTCWSGPVYLFFVFVLYWWEYWGSTLSKFQLYNTKLSTIVTMKYMRFTDLIDLITESLYSRHSLNFHSSPPAIPWQSLFYTISRNSKQIFRSHTHSMWYRAEFVFSSDLFHWPMSCRLIYVVIQDRISFFLRLNNISLSIYTIFSWAIHPLVDTWCVFVPWLLWIHASENLEMQISLS